MAIISECRGRSLATRSTRAICARTLTGTRQTPGQEIYRLFGNGIVDLGWYGDKPMVAANGHADNERAWNYVDAGYTLTVCSEQVCNDY